MYDSDNILRNMQNVFQFKVINDKQDVEVKHIKYIPIPLGEALRTDWYDIGDGLSATDYILRYLDSSFYIFKNIGVRLDSDNYKIKNTIIVKLSQDNLNIEYIKKEDLSDPIIKKLKQTNFDII